MMQSLITQSQMKFGEKKNKKKKMKKKKKLCKKKMCKFCIASYMMRFISVLMSLILFRLHLLYYFVIVFKQNFL